MDGRTDRLTDGQTDLLIEIRADLLLLNKANDATSCMYDHYLRSFFSVTWLINHFSAFFIGWDGDSIRNALFSATLMKA